MRALELTAQDRPANEESRREWDLRRSDALLSLMNGLRPNLADADPDTVRAVLPSLLNMGLGMETTRNNDPSNPSVTMALPVWPSVPW